MSHQVESMAYAHEVPWHNLGVKVDENLSYKEMLVAAGLDWRVELKQVYFKGGDKKQHSVPNRFALVRDTDDEVMSIASHRYNPVQNEEALRFFDRFIRAGKAKMETAGSLRSGRLVWALANLGTGFILPGGEAVKGYLLLGSPHEVGISLLGRTTAICVVCANTFAMATSGTAQFERRFSHAREFDADEASALFDSSREDMAEMEKAARTLQTMQLDKETAVKVLAEIYLPNKDVKLLLKDDKHWSPTMRIIMEAYESGPGADARGATAWGLFNAATYRANHVAGGTADSRMASAWVGQESKRSQKLMSKLLEAA